MINCSKCPATVEPANVLLGAEGELLCEGCYLADPPASDVDGVFYSVMVQCDPGPRAVNAAIQQAKVDLEALRLWVMQLKESESSGETN